MNIFIHFQNEMFVLIDNLLSNFDWEFASHEEIQSMNGKKNQLGIATASGGGGGIQAQSMLDSASALAASNAATSLCQFV